MPSPHVASLWRGLTLSIVLSLGSRVAADELTEGAKASHNVSSLRLSGLDLGFSMFGKEGGSTELQHLGPYFRVSLRFHFLFFYSSAAYYDSSLAFRRRALLIERAELSAHTVSLGQGVGFDAEVGRVRLAFFAEGEGTVWTSAVALDKLKITEAQYARLGDVFQKKVDPSYRWYFVRTGVLTSAQWGPVAPYASLGYLRFDAKFAVAMDRDLENAVRTLGASPDAANKHIVKDVPAGSLGAAVSFTKKWLLTCGFAFVPLDPLFEEWILVTNAAFGRRF